MKHTPGPWKLDLGLGAPEVVGNNRRIARVLYEGGSEDNEVDANARLIAAAPDLLGTLRYISKDAFRTYEGPIVISDEALDRVFEAIDALRRPNDA